MSQIELSYDHIYNTLKLRKQQSSQNEKQNCSNQWSENVFFEDLQIQADICSDFFEISKNQFINILLLYDSRQRGAPLTIHEFSLIMNFVFNTLVSQTVSKSVCIETKTQIKLPEDDEEIQPNFQQQQMLQQRNVEKQKDLDFVNKYSRAEQTTETLQKNDSMRHNTPDGDQKRISSSMPSLQEQITTSLIIKKLKISSQQKQFILKQLIQRRCYNLTLQQKSNLKEIFDFYLHQQYASNYNFTSPNNYDSRFLNKDKFLHFCDDFGLIDFNLDQNERAKQILNLGNNKFFKIKVSIRLFNSQVLNNKSHYYGGKILTLNELTRIFNAHSQNFYLNYEQFELTLRSIGKFIFLKRLVVLNQFQKIKQVPEIILNILLSLSHEMLFNLIDLQNKGACRKKFKQSIIDDQSKQQNETQQEEEDSFRFHFESIKYLNKGPQLNVRATLNLKELQEFTDIKEVFRNEIKIQRQLQNKQQKNSQNRIVLDKVSQIRSRKDQSISQKQYCKNQLFLLQFRIMFINITFKYSAILSIAYFNILQQEEKNNSLVKIGKGKNQINNLQEKRINRSISTFLPQKEQFLLNSRFQEQNQPIKFSFYVQANYQSIVYNIIFHY